METVWTCDICERTYYTYNDAEDCERQCEKVRVTLGGLTLGGGVYGPAQVEGRDIISKKTVFKPNRVVQTMMENMGWVPHMGLGAHLQGITEPIDTQPQCVRYTPYNEGGRGGIGYC